MKKKNRDRLVEARTLRSVAKILEGEANLWEQSSHHRWMLLNKVDWFTRTAAKLERKAKKG